MVEWRGVGYDLNLTLGALAEASEPVSTRKATGMVKSHSPQPLQSDHSHFSSIGCVR